MQHTVVVRHGNMLRQKQTSGNVTGHFTRNIVSLSGSQTGILVGIFLRQLLILIRISFKIDSSVVLDFLSRLLWYGIQYTSLTRVYLLCST